MTDKNTDASPEALAAVQDYVSSLIERQEQAERAFQQFMADFAEAGKATTITKGTERRHLKPQYFRPVDRNAD